MHGIIPNMFDYWVDPVVPLHLVKIAMDQILE